MTDGENREEYRLEPEYASGVSDVIKTSDGGSVYYTGLTPEASGQSDGDNDFPEAYFYGTHPFGSSRMWDNRKLIDHPSFRPRYAPREEQLDWPEVWAEMSPDFYGYFLYGRRLNLNWWQGTGTWVSLKDEFWDRIHWTVDSGEKDRRLRQVCAAANAAGVVIYSIGMDVDNTNSLNLLKDCASSESHYFDVEGLEIQTAFDMIAASISMLRLTK